jgi:hypothetical protein
MIQAVIHQPLTGKVRVRAVVRTYGLCGGESVMERIFSEFFGFPLQISFHNGSPYSYIWRMNDRPVGGRSSGT